MAALNRAGGLLGWMRKKLNRKSSNATKAGFRKYVRDDQTVAVTVVTFPVSSSVSHPAGGRTDRERKIERRKERKALNKEVKLLQENKPQAKEPHHPVGIFTFTISSCSLVLSACLDV